MRTKNRKYRRENSQLILSACTNQNDKMNNIHFRKKGIKAEALAMMSGHNCRINLTDSYNYSRYDNFM